jgi:RNA polymerase sigma factor for flagellar operon FliA
MASTANAQKLIEECQGLVRSLASRIHHKVPPYIDLEDLVAYGQVGLAEAARDFDPSRGTQFSTFAYYRIRGAIYDGLAKMSWFSRVEYGRRRNQNLTTRVLSWQEAENGVNKVLSIEDVSTPSPPAVAMLHEVCQRLDELTTALPKNAGELIHAAYSEGLQLQEAGRRIGISKSWASRQHRKAIRRLAGDRRLSAMM